MTLLYEILAERFPELSLIVKARLLAAAEKLIGADLLDREACCDAVSRAVAEYARETP